MDLYKRIRTKRLELKMSQDELAKKTGYTSRSSINKIESGQVDLPQSKIIAFAKALNTTPAYLMGWEEETFPSLEEYGIQPISTKKLPLLGKIACGEPIYADEDRESYVEIGTDIHADFCLKATGDSMINARIYDGDIVFIRKQPMVDNGEIAAVIIDDEATLKRVEYIRDKNIVMLKPENPKYETMVYSKDELSKVRIIGKAIAFQSDII